MALNMGWEVTEPLDVEMEVAGPQLNAVLRSGVSANTPRWLCGHQST